MGWGGGTEGRKLTQLCPGEATPKRRNSFGFGRPGKASLSSRLGRDSQVPRLLLQLGLIFNILWVR